MESPATLARVALIGTLWLGSLFLLLPRVSILLNEALRWPRWQHPALEVSGWVLIGAGVAVSVYAAGLFRLRGGGTPVPTDPPKHLVRAGLYRYSRNPIFLADVAIVLGIFCVRGHLALLLYAGLVFLGLHLWLTQHEEPVLVRRFGEQWQDYARSVPRWLVR